MRVIVKHKIPILSSRSQKLNQPSLVHSFKLIIGFFSMNFATFRFFTNGGEFSILFGFFVGEVGCVLVDSD